ncbi:hypothetical protein D3C75_1064600 [compost metagenome]
MDPARVAGAMQPQFTRGVAGQQPGFQHAIFDDVPALGAYAFAVERRRGQPFQQVRMFFNGHPFRQDLFTQRIQQEGGFAINAAAADSTNQVAKQTSSHF